MHQNYIVILAGGLGERYGGVMSKQFQAINGVPVIIKTICKFLQRFEPQKIRIVVNPDHIAHWNKLKLDYPIIREITFIDGGEQRFHSVKNGLASIDSSDNDLIGIHDGVRPFVTLETIDHAYTTASQYGTAVPVFNAVNTIRIAKENQNNALDRQYVKIVQNPQVFRSKIIKTAYCQNYTPDMLDDGTIVEKAGYKIQLCQGNYENIKITHPQDLYIAEGLDRLLASSSIETNGKIYGNSYTKIL
ncbi:IspD/TarI family cytidylyltransferase [Sphingobacterium siyangense]|uniref:IspD/TarI family cytidylyltransferase n=1 Tax=Sphingobacterium siyangense TaxID=459529 RepID=UPI002061481B|nr:IspD/TarI family cytidylyltransferase [Sphingobacterium siyangense]UQA73357.1 2-C-methyl-D-erythritol 4-phosphate cytidylyltransferase [Sphingobacterium siyangense]